MCLKNLTISGFDILKNCTLNLLFETYKTKCGCSLLTLSSYSAFNDLPLITDDNLPINDNLVFSPNSANFNSEVTDEISNPIKFPIFQPSTDSSQQQQQLNNNLSVFSNNKNQPLTDHLKVFYNFNLI